MKFTYNNQEFKLILFTLAGSRFYGTHFNGRGSDKEHPLKPDYVSDNDYRGVFIASPDTKLGFTGSIEQIEVKKGKDGTVPKEQQELIKELNEKLGMNMPMDEDIALYEVKKFITMSLEANPNIMDLLYADDESVLYSTKKGRKLLKNRDIFLSKKVKHTFAGYALSQLNRIRGTVAYSRNTISILNEALENGDIDDNWIKTNFKHLHAQKVKHLAIR